MNPRWAVIFAKLAAAIVGAASVVGIARAIWATYRQVGFEYEGIRALLFTGGLSLILCAILIGAIRAWRLSPLACGVVCLLYFATAFEFCAFALFHLVVDHRFRREDVKAALLGAAALGTGITYAVALSKMRLRGAAFCHACGYDLSATPGRCPECGTAAASSAARPG